MKVLPLPEGQENRSKKCASLHRTGVFYNVCIIGFAVLAVALLLAMFIAVVVYEFKGGLENNPLAYILVGAFTGGAVLLALAAFLVNLLARAHRDTELDFRERCDGEESFFVGEGTLATFTDKGLRIHGEGGGKKETVVPYAAMRFFSVCTRRAPKEKGEWSVVFEIPARYLSGKEEAPALVQTDAKPRLEETLSRRGLTLLGEKRGNGGGKFTLRAKFILPDLKKRRTALLFGGGGLLLTAAGVAVGVLWQIAVGAVLGFFGLLLFARSVMKYLQAKSLFCVYDEGIFWKDGGNADNTFLKIGEIERIGRTEDGAFLRVSCAYGAYRFPCVGDAESYLKEKFPEKFEA